MGKSRPRNKQKNRTDPTGRPKPPADPELAAIREQRILPVLKDLQSSDLKTRSSAASAISNIIEDTKSRKLLLREQIVKILFEQTLTDSSLETRTAGWGILRNLALEEEADFCIHLYRQDVLTGIEGVVKTIIQTIESQEVPFSKLPTPQQTLVWSLTSSVVSLLSSLSEAQDEIVEAITKLPTIPFFLFGLLSFDPSPIEVKNEALSSLAALVEDNKPLAEKITEDRDWLKLLMQIKGSETPINVAACGVLHNIFSTMQWSDHKTPMEGASDATLIPTLVHTMEKASSHTNGNGTNGTSPSSPDQILQLALEIIASISTSLQEALESGHEKEFEGFDEAPTAISETEADAMDADVDVVENGEDAEGEEDGEEEEDDEMNMSEIEADMELVTGADSDTEPSDEATLELLIHSATPAILPLASSPSPGLQSSALSALNNIAWTISSIDFSTGHLTSIQKSWALLAQKIWDAIVSPVLASNTADITLASAVTSLAWAVARSVGGAVQLQPEEQRKFMALYQASKSLKEEDTDAFQSLGVKTIGVLGSLALSPAPTPLNREIGIFLLTVLQALPETPVADAVEALNQVMDIYADEGYAFDEPVFWGDGFYSHLEAVLPKARKAAKAVDKRKVGELRARADEVVLNLVRFLKYKKTEKARRS